METNGHGEMAGRLSAERHGFGPVPGNLSRPVASDLRNPEFYPKGRTAFMITSTATKRHRESINVNMPERVASVLGGSFLVARGIAKRSWSGLGIAALGGVFMYRGATGHCDLYQALGVNTNPRRRGRHTSVPYELGIRVDQTVVIQKPAGEVYRFFRNLENLPRFMKHLESVREIDNKHSHWEAKGPAVGAGEGDAGIINEWENPMIAGGSVWDVQVDNARS